MQMHFCNAVLVEWMNGWKDEPEQGRVTKNKKKKNMEEWKPEATSHETLCMFPPQRQHTLLINCDGILRHCVFTASCFGERIVVALGSPSLSLSLSEIRLSYAYLLIVKYSSVQKHGRDLWQAH